MDPVILYALYGVVLVGVIATLLSGFFTVHTMQAGIVERFGKFLRVAQPGLNFKLPFLDRVVYVEDLNMQLMDVPVASKTKDDATITIPVRVQYFVLPDKVWDAYYRLDDPEAQIKAHVENTILSYIPKLTLDETYEQEDQIAKRIKESLSGVMAQFGYAIENALVRKIEPDTKVVAAMNDINAARRERVATEARAEAAKILKVKEAEAEAEAKALQGQGVARQRQAIVEGLRKSVEDFGKVATDVGTRDVMSLVMMTQYFDALKEIGAQSNTILLPHSPAAVESLREQLLGVLSSAALAADAARKQTPGAK